MTGGTDRIGRFELGERIAAGGMASVHAATTPPGDRLHGCPIALKVLHDHLADEPDFVRMFRDEGKIASRMAHPGVVRVYEVGEADGRHYIAMERIDGYNLAQILTAYRHVQKKGVPAAAVYAVLRQVLAALVYVHEFSDKRGRRIGIVHRDISPQNILIGRDERVRLIDFGIARGQHRADRTQTGTVKGKLHYMPPEQARGQRVDARADLYALGAVAFEMWTQQPLHGAGKTGALHEQAARGAVDFEQKPYLSLKASIRAWLKQSLEVDPERRFESARHMLSAMEDIPGANRARFKPGTLNRLLKVTDNFDAEAIKRGPQYLFSEAEMRPTTRKSEVNFGPQVAPARPMSREFVGASVISSSKVGPSDRLEETMGPPRAWTKAGKGARPARLQPARSPTASKALPVDAEAANSGMYRRAYKSKAPIRSSSTHPSATESSAQPASAKDGTERRPAGVESTADKRPGSKAGGGGGRSGAGGGGGGRRPKRSSTTRLQARSELEKQRSLAAASVVMWSSVALLLFAMLLESWNARVEFPRVDEQTFVAWFSAAPSGPTKSASAATLGAAKRAPAAAASKPVVPIKRPPKRPRPTELRNDRFLPRQAILPKRALPPSNRVATAPAQR